MAEVTTRRARLHMKTATGMYDFAVAHQVAGWPRLQYPFAWLGKRHFKNIERSLASDETVVVAFITKMAGLTEVNGPKGRYKWYAFALGDSGTLYFAHWRPFHLDSLRMTLDQINTINPNTGIVRGKLQIQTLQGSQDLDLKWFAPQIRRIYSLLNDEKHAYDKLRHGVDLDG
jgi:hypothetical protein